MLKGKKARKAYEKSGKLFRESKNWVTKQENNCIINGCTAIKIIETISVIKLGKNAFQLVVIRFELNSGISETLWKEISNLFPTIQNKMNLIFGSSNYFFFFLCCHNDIFYSFHSFLFFFYFWYFRKFHFHGNCYTLMTVLYLPISIFSILSIYFFRPCPLENISFLSYLCLF